MKKAVLLSIIALTVIISVSIVAARQLPAIGNVEKTMFKNLVRGYLHPAITGWGIGLNTEEDSYLIAKFHAVTVKVLPRSRITQIIREAKQGNATTWTEVRNRLRNALDDEGTTLVKGRIHINKEHYILTGIVRTNTTFSGDIRTIPNYSECVAANISAEDCEIQSTKVGELSLTRKDAEFEPSKDRVWAGTMELNETTYTFVALVNPRLSGEVGD